jgi:hypothetical protein
MVTNWSLPIKEGTFTLRSAPYVHQVAGSQAIDFVLDVSPTDTFDPAELAGN